MVGMPFPNPSDPELVERMRYLDCKEPTPPTHQLVTSGREFYEDLCMKVQSFLLLPRRPPLHTSPRNSWALRFLFCQYSFLKGQHTA